MANVEERRPSPDELLARVEREEREAKRGELRIFFGACAGVGKTYAMLSAAREQKAAGVDIVIGLVETHGRKETAGLLEGLEILPRRRFRHRGVELQEFDLDAALARRPALIVVDELAHTNAPGSRRAKRWQDVDELVEAGIDVYTAMNVQHLESLNDVVGKITGVRVMETVPDKVFDAAHEIELVDLPPDELIARLNEGKVYMPEAAQSALSNFFRKGNLIALREMALRRTAERVDAQMRVYREDEGIRAPWPVAERILVCVGPGPYAEQVVRAGSRIAARAGAEWLAVYVETPRLERLAPDERDRILRALRLAEDLGGESITLGGGDVAQEVLAYARTRNATRIVVGRRSRRGWRAWLPLSAADHILNEATDLEVHVVGEEAGVAAQPARLLLERSREYLRLREAQRRQRWKGYAWGVVVVAACTAIAAIMHPFFGLANLIMVYLLGVLVVAMRFGRGPSVLSVILSVAAFDFGFVPPAGTFAVSDTEYLVTFGVMLAVGLVISNLTANVRARARIAAYRERRTAALYAMSRELAAAEELEDLVSIAVKHIVEVFECQAVILLPDAEGRIRWPAGPSQSGSLHGADLSVAQWVFDHREKAGLGTDTLPAAQAHYMPLAGAADVVIGVLVLLPANPRRLFVPEQMRLLDTFASQIALAIERVRFATQAHRSELDAQSERLRSALLASISHDLRTPLASIVGAASGLAEQGDAMPDAARTELARTIHDEAQRMIRLVENVLQMARLQAGKVQLNRQWQPLEEIVDGTIRSLGPALAGHKLEVRIPGNLPMVYVDGVLIGQVMANLLHNAAKYAPRDTAISVGAAVERDEVVVWVSDEGPGLPPGEEERVFDKFHRAAAESAQSGVGLGLTICQAIVQLHGGVISAENLPAGGALFRFTLPLTEAPSEVADDVAMRKAA
jgi:two-component system, OmpR family, sensor histidine kinase KdpD